MKAQSDSSFLGGGGGGILLLFVPVFVGEENGTGNSAVVSNP